MKKYEGRLARLKEALEAIEVTVANLETIYGSTEPDDEKRQLKAREMRLLKERLAGLSGDWNGGLDSWINDPINNADPNGTNVATEYAKVTKAFAKRAIKFGKKVGKQLHECFTGIASALQQAAGGSGGGGNTGSCKKLPPIP